MSSFTSGPDNRCRGPWTVGGYAQPDRQGRCRNFSWGKRPGRPALGAARGPNYPITGFSHGLQHFLDVEPAVPADANAEDATAAGVLAGGSDRKARAASQLHRGHYLLGDVRLAEVVTKR